jgi:tetratricopeptide (TPR) repeat protein
VAVRTRFAYGALRRHRESREDFRKFLEALEPTVLLLAAGVVRRWSHTPSTGDVIEQYDRRAMLGALNERALSSEQIIDYVLKLPFDYRARYNLACYYARRGDDGEPEYFRKAFSELEASLKAAPQSDLVDWARKDPSLSGLRGDPDFKKKFQALICTLRSHRRRQEGRSSKASRARSSPEERHS